jgi:CheY-like chemotaxis protein
MAPRILVVDRNAAFATMLKEMLEADGGYEVSVARRGSDALTLLHDESFALTIIDMDLDPDDLDYRDLIPRVRGEPVGHPGDSIETVLCRRSSSRH